MVNPDIGSGKVLSINGIDVIEQDIADYSYQLLEILLRDRTTGQNIIWASDDYSHLGQCYEARKQMTPDLIIGSHTKLIQPRIAKTRSSQIDRTRDKAEVFTPAWICNAQNNLIDDAWFERQNVFNTPDGNTWNTTIEPITFSKHKNQTWQKYVDANRMEIACGEAPYLVSRYDATTGCTIPLRDRIGLLDRKLRVVNENTSHEVEWLKWTTRAFQSIYAYEFQGDNLLLARENLLYTFIDNIRFKLHREPTLRELKAIATVISWNLWQMDGMTFTIPYGKVRETSNQMTLFDFEYAGQPEPQDDAFSKLCQIKDWRSKVILEYKSLVKETRR
ncbi:MAG: restriction endonuclease subunit M [Planctomycetia bacterium]|nr:restriction endonuclease subunit M [Planctomycetia bacterium]